MLTDIEYKFLLLSMVFFNILDVLDIIEKGGKVQEEISYYLASLDNETTLIAQKIASTEVWMLFLKKIIPE